MKLRAARSRQILFVGILFISAVEFPSAGFSQETELSPGPVEVTIGNEAKSGNEIVVFPIPISNPTIGTGLGVASAIFYKAGADSRPSVTGLGGFYTTSESWGVGVFQKLNLAKDNIRLKAGFGYASLKYDFFGIGNAAGDRGIALPVTQKGFVFVPQVLVRLMGNIYGGIQYRLFRADTTIRLSSIDFAIELPEIPDPELRILSSGLGAVLQLDTRDNEYAPSRGWYIEFISNFARKGLGSDFSYETYNLAINRFLPLDENKTLAIRISGCRASGRVPLYDLCLFGVANDLRGYEGGQYRDRAMFAAQMEYRWRFSRKFGFVAFGGFGAVAPDFGSFEGDNLLHSVGLGLRYLAAEKTGVNVSVDFALGKDSEALYFRIGEAF